jgi:Fe2+ transport system protein FeoA
MTTLATLGIGATALVQALRLPDREATCLRAVGLYEGVEVMPLRRAPLGGPVHVRLSTGAELALDRQLALGVDVGGAPSP